MGEETLPIEFEVFSSHKLYVGTLVKSGDIEKNPGPRLVLFIIILFMLWKRFFRVTLDESSESDVIDEYTGMLGKVDGYDRFELIACRLMFSIQTSVK